MLLREPMDGLQTVTKWLVLFTLMVVPVQADTVLNFEQFTDGTRLTNQVPGLTFTNTTVLTAGISLNELEFPPHSGTNVATDDGGPITIAFAAPVSSFSGYFTYTVPLTLEAFDGNNRLIASAVSRFTTNLALSGSPGSSPNEFLQLLSTAPIVSVLITGNPQGGSFVVDDISFGSTSVPEPASCVLLFLGTAALVVFRSRKD